MKNRKVFRSEEGRQKILGYYRELIGKLDFPYMERYIDTSFGKTYVFEAGSSDHQPVVLIHGSCSNSSMWFGDVNRLSQHYHVFSVDIAGDAGSSEPNRLDPSTNEFTDWLLEVWNGLDIEKASLIGNSLGGWICLQFASRFPERVNSLILLAPSGIVPVKLSFIVKTLFFLMMGKKGQKAMRKMIFGNDQIPEEAIRGTELIGGNFNPMTGALPPLTNQQMGRLTMPVLYIAGSLDVTADIKKASERLKRFTPNAEIRILKNNGHVVFNTMDQVIPFLNKMK